MMTKKRFVIHKYFLEGGDYHYLCNHAVRANWKKTDISTKKVTCRNCKRIMRKEPANVFDILTDKRFTTDEKESILWSNEFEIGKKDWEFIVMVITVTYIQDLIMKTLNKQLGGKKNAKKR